MKLDQNYKFNHSFQSLPPFLYEQVRPTPMQGARLIHVTDLKQQLGLSQLSDKNLKLWLNGEIRLPGDQQISSRYAGHQFGVWAGQLGDGRAISLGEILTPQGERWEVQTKGSGLTPFSRMGDGKAVIRSSVREYLCSEAMQGLNIATTRVLALLTGEDAVYRETVEKSAIVARVFPSNLRFGHFEICFHLEKEAELAALIDYTRHHFFNGAPTEEMLAQIIQRTASLIAQWMGVGFNHGVMNTDNMSILGLTIDYGPFGFMEDTALEFVCNHSDHQGRYAYNQQPSVGMWNLERLLVCFMQHVPKEKLQELLNQYPAQFEAEYQKICRAKLGLKETTSNDFPLAIALLSTLDQLAIDFTFFFRQLSAYQKGQKDSLSEIWDYYGQREELIAWLKKYDERLALETLSDEQRGQWMRTVNPKYVLKNYLAQEVISEVEQGRDSKLKQVLEILQHPFDEHPEFAAYARPTPPELKHFEVSCSS